MPSICAATSSWLRYGSSPVAVRLRIQFGWRARSVCGPKIPVDMKARASLPSVWPQTLPSARSNDEARPINVIGAVEPRACGPNVFSTPWASVQHIGAIDGFVPVGASTGPTLWHVGTEATGPNPAPAPCSSLAAFASWLRVGGLLGSSWRIRSSTVGVYGARGSPGGDVWFAAGSTTGSEYGVRSSARAPGAAPTLHASASATPASDNWCFTASPSPTDRPGAKRRNCCPQKAIDKRLCVTGRTAASRGDP